MTRNRRTRVVGLAAALAAVPFFIPNGATAQGTTGSSNDPESYPPLPSECSGYLWWQNVKAEGAQVLSKSNPRILINGLTKPAGTVDVTEAITWDARETEEEREEPVLVPASLDEQAEEETSQLPDPELYEKMRVEFWNGGTFLGATPGFTPDLPDDAIYAWAVAALGQLDLWQDATEVYLVHASQWMETDGAENAFYPKAVCLNWSPFVSQPAASVVWDCDSATLTKTNTGKATAQFEVVVNGETFTFPLDPGVTIEHTIALAEDTTTRITISADGQLLLDETIVTDCVPATTVPATTVPPTVPPASPPTVATQPAPTVPVTEVLAATAEEPTLAFTGRNSAVTAGIGASLLAFGAALVGLGRRRGQAQA